MKVIIVALALVALASTAPAEVEKPVDIVEEEFAKRADGGYYSRFEAQNGIVQVMSGEVKEVRNEKNEPLNIIVIRGSYSYPKEDGTFETVEYYGDESGFHATGPSIPKVPGAASRR